MTYQEFDKVFNAQLGECRAVLDSKGADYTDGEDRFFNFKTVAALLGVTPELVLAVYWLKHVFAVAAYCGRGKVESEPIAARITDVINYPLLLKGLIDEKDHDQEADQEGRSEEGGEAGLEIPGNDEEVLQQVDTIEEMRRLAFSRGGPE